MKPPSWLYCSVFGLLIVVCQPQAAKAESNSRDSLSHRSANALVVEMARLIKQYAHFPGGTAVFRYDAWADTTQGLELHIGEQITVLGGRAEPDWYSIDFAQPIRADEFRVVMGRNDNFQIEASKKITKRTKNGKNKLLHICFCTNQKKRTTNFGQLYNWLAFIVSQLTRQ